ncbi:hypothetical protein N0V93_008819 [Gnomoniopsis smithogilvyi]|uniref:protein-L-isoaspartate(D-aspartate) O-methyltransferase n=1 Tax=Gnomoniopsis smithogilvyi TaxID=1191159 RepID=A0A9W8YQZ8_9PEZI|nr:hypothetical protein N0V93_008819 [Gnomoniopsis smithogilvyi]
MAWRSHGTSNETLVQQLWRNGLIKNERVRDAFLKVDRGHYAPRNPYNDSPQSIGHAATISAPHMHASALEHLVERIEPDNAPRVLDIGCGSGYLTHVLAELVGEKGLVVGLEHIPQLRDLSETNMRKSSEGSELLDSGRVRFRLGDGRKGWVEPTDSEGGSEHSGWDVIHVGAAAATLHAELVTQLRTPGRMFIPVDDEAGDGGQSVWVVDKDGEGKVETRRLFGVRYVPLTDGPGA